MKAQVPRVAAVFSLVLVLAACQPAGNSVAASPRSPGPSGVSSSEWKFVRLAGFSVHAGTAGPGGQLLLVGEHVDRRGGAVLTLEPSGQTLRVLATFPEALHIRSVAVFESRIWIAGDRYSGEAFLSFSGDAGKTWTSLRTPADFNDLDQVIYTAGRLIVGGQAGGGTHAGLASSGDGGSTWPLQRRAAYTGRPARFRAVSAQGLRVAVAGTDGLHGLLVESQDGGQSFADPAPVSGMSTASAVAFDGTRTIVGGYLEGSIPEQRVGVLATTSPSAAGWQQLPLRGCVAVGDLLIVDRNYYVLCATGLEHAILKSTDGGRTWESAPIQRTSVPVTLERLFAHAKTLYAVGPYGLYRSGG